MEVFVTRENRFIGALKNPKRTFQHLILRIYRLLPDRAYLDRLLGFVMNYKVDLDNPQTFNEKLNWLKLNDRNPLYHTLVDKYAVKEYVANIIGEKHVVPCYGVWDSFEEIDFDSLPNSFVLKPTHWGCPMVVKNKADLNYEKAKKYFEKCSKYNVYNSTKEWSYKDVKPRILADKFLDDHSLNNKLQDYKFWCFNGKPQIMYFTIKDDKAYENFFDMDFNPIEINHGCPRYKPEFEKPLKFDEMKELAARLSRGIPFVRMDFFCVDNVVYFGEYTMYDWGGVHPFVSYEQDLELGKLIELPIK